MKQPIFRYGEKEMNALRARDARLGAVIGRLGPLQRPVQNDLFTALVYCLIGQQISTKAHVTLWKRIQATLGDVTPERLLALGKNGIQALGMSFQKAGYLEGIARAIVSGDCNLEAIREAPDEDAIAQLSALRGVGRWTAEMLLIFCLQRPDILSFGDFGILRGMRMVYRHRVITPALFARYRRRLSPFCSVASLYFWTVAEGKLPDLTDPAPKRPTPKSKKKGRTP